MTSIVVEIPSDLSEIIKRHPEIDWKAIAQKSLSEYAHRIALSERLAQKSKLTEQDIESLDVHVKQALARRYQ